MVSLSSKGCCFFLLFEVIGKVIWGVEVDSLSNYGAIIWRIIPFVTFWSVRKERNKRIFQGVSSNVEDVVHLGFVHITEWISRRSEFDSLRMVGVLYNYEASLFSGAIKVSNLASWGPILGVLNLMCMVRL